MSSHFPEYRLCNCDGWWHVEIKGITYYIDVKDLVNELKSKELNGLQD